MLLVWGPDFGNTGEQKYSTCDWEEQELVF